MKKRFSLLISAAFVLGSVVAFAGGQSEESVGKPTQATGVSRGAYAESPMLATMVDAGELPSVERRLPVSPRLAAELKPEHLDYEVGSYGGTLRMASSQPTWSADTFVFMVEPLVSSPSYAGESFIGNVVESFSASTDGTTYTFTLREGLRWSDGEPVTMQDVEFAINDVLMNEEITASVPARYRTGGDPSAAPMKLEVVDEWTFRLVFDGSYHGFLREISMRGWPRYDELIKPAHYLRQYHKEYAEADTFAALLSENNFRSDEWGQMLTQFDATTSELMTDWAVNMPVLWPWIPDPANFTTNRRVFVRNPYYFKVDSDGQQLPYIDRITVDVVSDLEILNNRILAGDLDFNRESVEVTKMPLYRQNESRGGFRALVMNYHGRNGSVFLNQNWRGDADWHDYVNRAEFRQAISYAINREEIIDAVFFGLGTLPSVHGDPTFDVDRANQLLDSIGLDNRNSEGFRTYPNGRTVSVLFELSTRVGENLPIGELVVEMLRAVGVDASMRSMDNNLFTERRGANQIQATVERMEAFWWNADSKAIFWAPQWYAWYTSGGATGEEPPSEVQRLFELKQTVLSDRNEIALAAHAEFVKTLREGYYYLPVNDDSQLPLVTNAELGNATSVSGEVSTIVLNFSAEQFFYRP